MARLRIALDVKYPQIVQEARWAIHRVRGRAAGVLERPRNCVEVYSHWSHWCCFLPQHGPGKKHNRPIRLAAWQRSMMELWPWELLRGLIHSDGCRFRNTSPGWSAPRYSFKQRSPDVRQIFCDACAVLGIRWTTAPETVYVSRRRDVARLDCFVGPKR